MEGRDEDGTVPIHGGYINIPLSGRTDTHPVECFNDVSAFQEAYISYFGRRVEYRGELASDQYFESKQELIKKI